MLFEKVHSLLIQLLFVHTIQSFQFINAGLYIRVLDMVKDQNVNAVDKNGYSALNYAAKYGIFWSESQNYSKHLKLIFLCIFYSSGHEQIAKVLIENKYNVNHVNNDKQTPLDLAVIEGNYYKSSIRLFMILVNQSSIWFYLFRWVWSCRIVSWKWWKNNLCITKWAKSIGLCHYSQ